MSRPIRRVTLPTVADLHSDVSMAVRNVLDLLYLERAIAGYVHYHNDETGVGSLTIELWEPECDHRYEDCAGGGIQCMDCGHIIEGGP